MDVNLLRILVTIVSFILFVGIVVWAWRKRNSKDFKEAAKLPLEED